MMSVMIVILIRYLWSAKVSSVCLKMMPILSTNSTKYWRTRMAIESLIELQAKLIKQQNIIEAYFEESLTRGERRKLLSWYNLVLATKINSRQLIYDSKGSIFKMENWKRLCKVPNSYLKPIGFGNLKGKSDINPQWRIKAFTEVYGECGVGWYADTVEERFQECSNGEILVFTTVKLYTKVDDRWSAGVEGKGGNKIVSKNKKRSCPK